MNKRILIDATFEDETRVAVVSKNKIEDYDFEITGKQQNRGNTYLAKITRVEPSLQAAFVDFGEGRQGFLPFSAIHTDYYQIPKEDKEQLLREAEQEERERSDTEYYPEDSIVNEDYESESTPESVNENINHNDDTKENDNDSEESVEVNHNSAADTEAPNSASAKTNSNKALDSRTVAERYLSGDAFEESPEDQRREPRPRPKRKPPIHKRYQIQEVIKVDQKVLVQVLKEPRGNKGATLTTFISLVGKYSILMPNSNRGGGVSKKITNVGERKRLRKVLNDLDTPSGLIIRTASATSADEDIIRDYDYLVSLWNNIREKTLSSKAPCLIHKEGGILQRAMRDLNDQSVDEILVDGDVAYREVITLSEVLSPDRIHIIRKWEKRAPVFVAHGVESQLDKLHLPSVQMKSGGYLVINHTEALVSIDVNSGRSTKERSVEKTALQTNLEAAEEACRQMRLRDLAGIIIIDFIDMYDNRNRRAVERKVKDCLKLDRARVQYYRISALGLMEISRQRRREDITQVLSVPCQHCQGTGHILSPELAALQVFRAIESRIRKSNIGMIETDVPTELAIYLLNEKRRLIGELEDSTDTEIRISASNGLKMGEYRISKSRAKTPSDSSRSDDRSDIEFDSSVQPSDDLPPPITSLDENNDQSKDSQSKTKKRNRKKPRRKKNKHLDEKIVEEQVSNTPNDETIVDDDPNPVIDLESDTEDVQTNELESPVDDQLADNNFDEPVIIERSPDLLSELAPDDSEDQPQTDGDQKIELPNDDPKQEKSENAGEQEPDQQHETASLEIDETPKKKRRGWWNR